MEKHVKDALKIDYLSDDCEDYTQIENVKRAKRILEMYSEGENSFTSDLEEGNKVYCKKHIKQLQNYIKKYNN